MLKEIDRHFQVLSSNNASRSTQFIQHRFRACAESRDRQIFLEIRDQDIEIRDQKKKNASLRPSHT